MKSLEELKQIREEARRTTHFGDEEENIRLIVGMGTCGIAAGARDTLKAIMLELEERGLNDVILMQTGCAGHCDQEPLVEVVLPGESGVTYGRVDANRARRIIIDHVIEHQVVAEYVVNR